ncbi:MAG: YjjG family noncanonical pyrimidine nucleotidase [Chitinophagales bacterium]
MKQYKHVFFDLDETLWDFKTNSHETLSEVFGIYHLEERGITADAFYRHYYHHNNIYWDLFRKGAIGREDLRLIRFIKTLSEFNVTDEVLAKNLSASYLQILPTKTRLHDDAIDVLTYLKKKYSLHIITNGFEEVQFLKMRHSGLVSYFKYVITSEMAGSQKPNREIFKYAFDMTNASAIDSIFIGDSIEADIHGAKSVGMDHVLFNPEKLAHNEMVMHEIAALNELKLFL